MRLVHEIHAAVCRTSPRAPAASTEDTHVEPDTAPIAADADLDRDGGDPKVRVLPRAWKGEDLRGRRFSECPENFLGQFAHLLEWRAGRNTEEGKVRWAIADAREAALARAWRRRLAERGSNEATTGGSDWL